MFYLIIGISCNILLLLILKAFQKFKIASFPAIVVNYFSAGSIAFLFTNPKSAFLETPHLWMPALLLGVLFVCVFNLISLTIEKNGVSVATVSNKMSVVIPVILAFIIYKDSPHLLKILGIIIALLSVFLVSSTSPRPNGHPSPAGEGKGGRSLLPIAVFLGSGLIDALVNYVQKKLVHSDAETSCFSGLTFFAAGIIGVLAFIFFYKEKELLISRKQL